MEVLVTHRDRLQALAEKLVAEETVDSRGVRGALQRPAAEGEHPRRHPELVAAGQADDRFGRRPGAGPGLTGTGPEPGLTAQLARSRSRRARRALRPSGSIADATPADRRSPEDP